MNTSANDRNEQKRLYRMMQQYAFVLQETALYLDCLLYTSDAADD